MITFCQSFDETRHSRPGLGGRRHPSCLGRVLGLAAQPDIGTLQIEGRKIFQDGEFEYID